MKTIPYPDEATKLIAYKEYMLNVGGHVYTIEEDARVLLWLAGQILGDCVEIGCNEGMFTRALAEWYPGKRVYAIDSAYIPLPQEQEYERVKEVCRFAKHLTNVTVIDSNSRNFVYPSGIGFIFIDGDHSLEGVKADTEAALKYKEKHPDLTIAWHDYRPSEWHGVAPYLDRLAEEGLPLILIENTPIVILQ